MDIAARRYLGRSLLVGGARVQPPAATVSEGAATATATSLSATVAPAPTEAAVVGEEERADVFWEAPFLLLVQDDSDDPQLEYGNRAALRALRINSFDEATSGLSVAGLVDPEDARSQQEWLWACTEAAERPERCEAVPRAAQGGRDADWWSSQ